MKILTEKSYQNLIDFIDVATGSEKLMNWLINLEGLPDNLRSIHLAKMKDRMVSNREPEKIINIMESINDQEILSAINLVIKDVHNSGMEAKKYLKTMDNENFIVLIGLLAAIK